MDDRNPPTARDLAVHYANGASAWTDGKLSRCNHASGDSYWWPICDEPEPVLPVQSRAR